MSIKNYSYYSFLILFLAFLPLFLVINGYSVSLPESYYEANGIPFHFSFFILFFLAIKSLKNIFLPFLLIIFYLSINFIFSIDRTILTFQAIQPFLFLTVFNNSRKIYNNTIVSYISISFILIVFGNFIYSIYNNGFELLVTRSFFLENFYVIKFYQSLLSFPLILNCVLLLLIYQYNNNLINNKFFLFSNILIIFLQIILLRRIGIFNMVFIYIIFFPKVIKWLIFFLFFAIFFFNFKIQNLEFLERIFDSDSYSSRENTWNENLFLLKQYKIILWGVGENTYAHNYFLGQLITFGLPLALLNFLLNFINILKLKYLKNKYIFTLVAIFLLDSFFNSNLTQTYTVFAFSFLLIYFKLNLK